MRGSFIGHEDYITHVIAEMTKLSVTSSNSLRCTSLSARKRAQSLGRLGELEEGDSYQYLELAQGPDQGPHQASATYWQDRIRQVRSESGSPKLQAKTGSLPANGVLPRAKSSHQIDFHPAPAPSKPPAPPAGPKVSRTGSLTGHHARPPAGPELSPGNKRPAPETGSRVNRRVKPAGSLLPDLLASAKGRPHSSYDLNVRAALAGPTGTLSA